MVFPNSTIFLWSFKKIFTFATPKLRGAIAQLVEQRTENPCVPGSIPGGTTGRGENENLPLFICAHYALLCLHSIQQIHR